MADAALPGESGFTLHCRGDVRLFCGTSDCTPRSKKGRALLAILAAEQRPLSRVKIIDLLWSDRQEEQARASLRTLLADLKEQFNSRFNELLIVDRERVALGPGVRTDLADAALTRPAGELFEGLDHIDPQLDEWLRLERERWEGRMTAPSVEGRAPEADRRPQAWFRKTMFGRRAGYALIVMVGAVVIAVAVDRPNASGRAQEGLEEARALLRQGSPAAAERARQILLDVVESNPNDASSLATLAEATMAASDHPGIGGSFSFATAKREARAYSLRAIRLSPKEPLGWAALGFSRYGTAEGIAPLEKAVALDPDVAKYRWQLGRALEYAQRYDEALLHLRRAMELDPLGAEPVIGFLRVAAQLDRVDEMKAQTLAYQRRGARPRDVAFVQGYLGYHLNDEPNCIRHLEPLVERGDYRPLSILVSCLTSLGEKNRAAQLSSSTPSFRLDILREDAAAVERRAASMGREFWLRNFESLAAADLLVRAGKSDALIRSFDASYDNVAEFEREGSRVAMEPTSLLLAMQIAGRSTEARQLRQLLAKQVKDQRDGMALDTWSLLAKAALVLADGDEEQSISLLEQCFPDCLVGIYDVDIGNSAYFGRLNGHPRFDRLIERHRQLINGRRKRAGLRPLEVG